MENPMARRKSSETPPYVGDTGKDSLSKGARETDGASGEDAAHGAAAEASRPTEVAGAAGAAGDEEETKEPDLCGSVGVYECPKDATAVPDDLPDSVVKIRGSAKLKHLPDRLPPNLTELDLAGCVELEVLPDLAGCKDLKVVRLGAKAFGGKGAAIKELPALPPGLLELDVYGCKNLQVTGLVSGVFYRCPKDAKELPEDLPSTVAMIECTSCDKLTQIPSKLPAGLRKVVIQDCFGVKKLPDFGETNVQELWVGDSNPRLQRVECDEVPGLPDGLSSLTLSGWKNLKSLPPLPPSLQDFDASYCTGLTVLPDLPESLKTLKLCGSRRPMKITCLPPLPPSLQNLNLESCAELKSLPPLPPSLQDLNASYCEALTVPDLSNTKIEKLSLRGNGMESLPPLPPSLQNLNLVGCDKLESLPPLPPSLQDLNLYGCAKLTDLPDLSNTKIEKLNCERCSGLESLPPLPPSLQDLDASYCKGLTVLPDLSLNTKIEKLYLENCSSLKELPDALPLALKNLQIGSTPFANDPAAQAMSDFLSKRPTDRDTIEQALQKNGNILQFLSDDMRADHELILAATTQYGGALLHCDKSLLFNDDAFLKKVAAVKDAQGGYPLYHIARTGKLTEELLMRFLVAAPASLLQREADAPILLKVSDAKQAAELVVATAETLLIESPTPSKTTDAAADDDSESKEPAGGIGSHETKPAVARGRTLLRKTESSGGGTRWENPMKLEASSPTVKDQLTVLLQAAAEAHLLDTCEWLVDNTYVNVDVASKCDSRTPRTIGKASSDNDTKDYFTKVGCFLGRYMLGKVEHESATSKVVHAVDYLADEKKGEPSNVVVKFMSDPMQHLQELETRQKGGLDPKFTVGVLKSSDEFKSFAEEAEKLKHYAQGIVMGAGERNLDAIFRHEKPSVHAIRDMFKQLFEAVGHLHSKGFVHGDLKGLNVVRFGSDNRLRLIDFDAAARIPGDEPAKGVNEWAGAKFSSGTLPPELLYRFKDAAEQEAFEEYFAGEKLMNSELWTKIAPKVGRKSGALVVKTFSLQPPRQDDDHIEESNADTAPPARAGGRRRSSGLRSLQSDCKVDANGKATNAGGKALPYAIEEASTAIDVWALGTMLFLFLAEENLVPVNRNDDITKAADMAAIADWDEFAATARLGVIKDPVARDLVATLLDPNPQQRKKLSLQQLLNEHPFFNPESTDANIQKQLEEINKRTKDIKADTGQLITMGKALSAQVKKTQAVLLTGIFEATEVLYPTSCIILPHKLTTKKEEEEQRNKNESKVKAWGNKLFGLLEAEGEKAWDKEEDDDDDEVGEGGEEEDDESKTQQEENIDDEASRFGRMKRWFNKAVKVGKALKPICEEWKDGNYAGAGVEAAKQVGDMKGTFYLYLIDEVTGKPVVPEDDGGKYPIRITKPGELVGKLMPFMKAGLKVMKVANGVCSVAQCFFPGVPTIPASIRKKADDAIGALDKESSVAEFDTLSDLLDNADDPDGNKKRDQRGESLREFEKFLVQHDPNRTFAGMRRVVFKTGKKAGTAVWTLEEDDAVINKVAEASQEKIDAEERMYALHNELRKPKNALKESKSEMTPVRKNSRPQEGNHHLLRDQLPSSSSAGGTKGALRIGRSSSRIHVAPSPSLSVNDEAQDDDEASGGLHGEPYDESIELRGANDIVLPSPQYLGREWGGGAVQGEVVGRLLMNDAIQAVERMNQAHQKHEAALVDKLLEDRREERNRWNRCAVM